MKALIAAVCLAGVTVGCGDDDVVTPPPASPEAIVRSNLRPDSTEGWLYYSFSGDSVVPASQAATSAWDVKVAYLQGEGRTRSVDVLFNSGNAGSGTTRAMVWAGRFEQVATIPTDESFRTEDTAVANRIVPNCVLCPNAIFAYDLISHTISPAPDKTVLVRLANGSVVKFQITSIYRDAVAAPTMFTPIGFYHFRWQWLRKQ